jgi:hypothetical protein
VSELSWKANRRGEIYCAPACGRGCTIHEFRDAERKALKLAARLAPVDTDVKRGRWIIRVHENLGWHWCVTKGAVTVHRYCRGSYAAYFNIAGPWGGNMVEHGSTPESSVHALMAKVRAALIPMVKLAERLL